MPPRAAVELLVLIRAEFDREEWRIAIAMALGQYVADAIAPVLAEESNGGIILPEEDQTRIVASILGALSTLSPETHARVDRAVSVYGEGYHISELYREFVMLFPTEPQSYWISRANHGSLP